MKVVWDKVGDRRFETGLDRGVLYLPDGSAVPWNGLTSVTEDTSDVTTESFWFDGVKYLELRSSGDFSGTLQAYTYPVEFDMFSGLADVDKGMLVANQPVVDTFGLTYRTLVGNDVDGSDHGYKIHILYNLTATQDNAAFNSLSDQITPNEFSWKISGIPEIVPGFRPTAHAIFDTTKMNRFLIADIENLLYGQDSITPPTLIVDEYDGGSVGYSTPDVLDGGTAASSDDPPVIVEDVPPILPSLFDLMELVKKWVLVSIIDNGDGTWTATGPDELITMLDPTTFQITGTNAEFLDADTYEISSAHGF